MASVLIVDDEGPIRAILMRWLSAEGYVTREADGADAALVEMAADPAGLVFCDMQMPGHDGRWLTVELRRQFPQAAIVLATADSTVPANTSMQMGVMAYLLKPFNRDAVLDAARRGLAWHEAAVATGPRPEDGPGQVHDWLDALDADVQ